MRTRLSGSVVRWVVLAVCACVLPASRAQAQGDGPHNLPLIPIGTNIFTPQVLVLSGNFNPQQTVLVPGAEIDVVAVPVTYIRTFALGNRFGRLFLVAPISTARRVGRGRSIRSPADCARPSGDVPGSWIRW